MPVRVPVSPEVLAWALHRAPDEAALVHAVPTVEKWLTGQSSPTVKQLTDFATRTRTPYGYFFLPEPPEVSLPVPDFRDGYGGAGLREPSADLLAVVHQSIRRQDWYRDYADSNGLPDVDVVESAKEAPAKVAAAAMREALGYEVHERRGSWNDQKRYLLQAFEELGGLTVGTSMVENNTSRLLDPDEFRGFSLVDRRAPLVFVNTRQSLNGQLFTIAHEFAHVWRGVGGIGLEDMRWRPQNKIEQWCNLVASEFLVPEDSLRQRYPAYAELETTHVLEYLAKEYRCGTLVVLHALNRLQLRKFSDFDKTYQDELTRLKKVDSRKNKDSSGDFYKSQPYRIGRRLSRALIGDTLAGNTPLTEAMSLTSLKALSTFDEYVDDLGGRAD